MKCRVSSLIMAASLTWVSCSTEAPVNSATKFPPKRFRGAQRQAGGVITNPSGSTVIWNHLGRAAPAPGVQLVALFGPEHGIYGDVPAGDKIQIFTENVPTACAFLFCHKKAHPGDAPRFGRGGL